MRFSEAKQGRIFVIRLEDGEILHECIERFAREQGIEAATVVLLGGADAGSRLIVGPEADRADPIVPCDIVLDRMHEVTGTGTLFLDPQGNPMLHAHIACGRGDVAKTGCVRRGIRVWHVMEVVVFELLGSTARRRVDAATGLEMLSP
jgi:predicted DNA-binding protein with PD1-like motif